MPPSASPTRCRGADVAFLADHGLIVCGESLDLNYIECACQLQILAAASGSSLAPVEPEVAERTATQTRGERQQSRLFFESLRRRLPDSSSGAQ